MFDMSWTLGSIQTCTMSLKADPYSGILFIVNAPTLYCIEFQVCIAWFLPTELIKTIRFSCSILTSSIIGWGNPEGWDIWFGITFFGLPLLRIGVGLGCLTTSIEIKDWSCLSLKAVWKLIRLIGKTFWEFLLRCRIH